MVYTWLMKPNLGKCKVMHFGTKNSRAQYCIGGKFLGKSWCKRDLGVMASCDLGRKTQVRSAMAKANRVLGLLKRTLVSREVGLWTRLCYPSVESVGRSGCSAY